MNSATFQLTLGKARNKRLIYVMKYSTESGLYYEHVMKMRR